MSEVEQYYTNMSKHFPNSRPWTELHPEQQMMFIQAINMILSIFQ